MDKLRITVLTSGASSLGLIGYLQQINKLAGVLILGPWDQEKAMLAQQLSQANISVQSCANNEIDTPITAITSWKCDLGIVFCCREKIPLSVANTPKYGSINLHGSPLPNYRGADPVYWQIRNGETQSALTAHLLTDQFDQGNIVAQEPILIGPFDTANRLFSNLIQSIPALLETVFEQIKQFGQLQERPQQGECLQTAARLTEQDLVIYWHKVTAKQLCSQVRAGNPQHGGARLNMGQSHAQLLQATPSSLSTYNAAPGTIIHLSPDQGLIVALKEESIRLDIIANNDGVLDGYRFAKVCQLSAGMKFT